jgi:anhydro-N-acetylmuramic acid kinase
MDGVDAVLVSMPVHARGLTVLGHEHVPFGTALRHEILALNSPGIDEIHRSQLVANQISRHYAEAVDVLLLNTATTACSVIALGAHGQTIRHRPLEFDGTGYTVQLINGALLAELTGIDVVCDFRSRDIAAGGQGAPLVPAFHAALWHQQSRSQAVLNLGGIANLTLISAEGSVTGFDTGPGNMLLDLWCEQRLGKSYDEGGAWAATGKVIGPLLDSMLNEPYFKQPAPKSTGRDLFSPEWLTRHLANQTRAPTEMRSADVQATLIELTAATVAGALKSHQPVCESLAVCGGGAYNNELMRRLQSRLPELPISATTTLGLPPLQVESVAFAWLACAHMNQLAGNAISATGANNSRILGAHYPR